MSEETLFCVQCGTPGAGDARFCDRCGRPMSEGVAPPSTPVAAQARTKTAKGLWNPNAAVLWSVVFTPALGAYLQALNWRTLNEAQRESVAMRWFWATLGLLGVSVLALVIFDKSPLAVGWPYLLLWYFLQGKKQVDYVEKRFGKKYPRHAWGKVLLLALGGLVVFVFVAGLLDGLVNG